MTVEKTLVRQGSLSMIVVYNFRRSSDEVTIKQQCEDAIQKYGRVDKIVMMHYVEYEITENDLRKLDIQYIQEHRIPLDIITCAMDTAHLAQSVESVWKSELPNYVKIIVWPEFYFHRLYHNMVNRNPFYAELLSNDYNFKTPYSCYMAKAKIHRTLLVEHLAKHDLIKHGRVSYWFNLYLNPGESYSYDWQHHDGSELVIDDDVFKNNRNPEVFDKKFLEPFLHCVVETSYLQTVITEKTVKPIFGKRPFLVLGGPGFHSDLENMGFALYDEIFDYSFDSQHDLAQRIDLYSKNIQLVVDNVDDLNDWYRVLLPKIEYNYKLAFDLVNDISNIPEPVKQRLADQQNLPFPHSEYSERDIWLHAVKNNKLLNQTWLD
jgi:hypothetical protein